MIDETKTRFAGLGKGGNYYCDSAFGVWMSDCLQLGLGMGL